MNLEQFQSVMESALAEIRKVIIGQEEAIRYSLVAVLCNQHALIEGVPGSGKDAAGAHAGRRAGFEFKRIQFTPDLMPADITGTNVFNLQRNEFTLVKGQPLFTTFLLADEINRAPARGCAVGAASTTCKERTVGRQTTEKLPVVSEPTPFLQPRIRLKAKEPIPCPRRERIGSCSKINMGWPEESEGEIALGRRSLGREAPEAVLLRGEVKPCLGERTCASLREVLEGIEVSEPARAGTQSRWCGARVRLTPFLWALDRGRHRPSCAFPGVGGAFRVTIS